MVKSKFSLNMNILSCYFGRHNRGCWKRLKLLLLYYANEGHLIRLLTSQKDDELEHQNIKQINISIKKSPQIINDLLFVILAPIYFSLVSILYKSTQLIAFDGHNAFFLNFARIFNRSAKLILLVRGHPYFQNSLNNDNKLIAFLISKIDKIGHKKSHLVIYNSYATSEKLIELYKTQYIPYKIVYNNCIIPPPSSPDYLTVKYRESLKTKEHKIIIGYAGQLITRKNIDFLILAFSKIKHSDKAILLIKGNGPLKKDLLKKVEKLNLNSKVNFLPWDNDISLFYKSIDIFILPSLYDDCSNTLLEALSHNCYTLASKSGGNVEILNYNQDLLFSIEDQGKDLIQKIDSLLEYPEQMNKMKTTLTSYAAKFAFNWEEKIRLTIEDQSKEDDLADLEANAKQQNKRFKDAKLMRSNGNSNPFF